MSDPQTAAATLLAYVSASGALGATAVIEAGTVDVEADGSASLEPPESPLAEPLDAHASAPLGLGVQVRALPPFAVDAEAGEVTGAMGALEHFAEGVRALAAALGGRSVALVRFPATDGETPFALAARDGEGLVVVIGDDQYEMDPSWP
jgi:hypothetical protein